MDVSFIIYYLLQILFIDEKDIITLVILQNYFSEFIDVIEYGT